MKNVLRRLRRADKDFNMIKQNETIAVGLSGGKDSMVLLSALCLYKSFAKVVFDIHAFTVDAGFGDFDTAKIAEYCASLGVKFTCVESKIAKIVFDIREEKNPCSLCSRLRKGALFAEIKRQGISKCAFAHHRDDCLETFFMSLLYEGRLRTFKPVMYLNKKDITLIRPFVYLSENEIKAAAKRHALPLVKNPCPVSGITKRQEIKELLEHICASNPDVRNIMLTALKNKEQYSLWD